MDSTQPPYSEKRFNEVKEQVTKLLAPIGYKDVPIIPMSGYKGDNIMKASANLSWWKGPTIMEALNNLKVPPKPTDKPLRIPVEDVYSITGIGTVPVSYGCKKFCNLFLFIIIQKQLFSCELLAHHSGTGNKIIT